MPPDSEVQFLSPSIGNKVRGYLKAIGSWRRGDLRIRNVPGTLDGLASIVERSPGEWGAVHLLVECGDACLLESYDTDFGIKTLYVTEAMDATQRQRFRQAMNASQSKRTRNPIQ
jgi:hypothetical protein